MRWLVVAVALLAACRGNRARTHDDAGPTRPAFSVSAIPKLPLSADGNRILAGLDQAIARTDNPRVLVPQLLERAAIRGVLDDYQRALAASAQLVEHEHDLEAWQLRVRALLAVHDFAGAREVMKRLAPLVVKPGQLVEQEIALADAAGDVDRVLQLRAEQAAQFASPTNLTLWAASLAQAGRFDDARPLIPKAAAAVHDNPPQLLAWLLFQWGRIHELAGDLAVARDFYAAAHERMPGYVEATAHLAQTMIATGDRAAAKKLVDDALTAQRHPELLALAVELGHPELTDEAKRAWERYVAALPLAFSDHAARFYLGIGHDPARALELARINHANRDTLEARALVIEAALAANDAVAACAVVDPLINGGTKAQRFVAWQALSRCGRGSAAEALGRALGVTP